MAPMLTIAQQAAAPAPTPLYVVGAYLLALLALGIVTKFFFRGTSADFFVASRSIGPFMLLMSIFGTTMTGFALVGSTGEAFSKGIGVYGTLASWSGLMHSAAIFLVGIRLWAIGKRHGYVTQVQFFRARFDSDLLGTLLFVAMILLIVPYVLIGILASGATVRGITMHMFPDTFPPTGAVPPWLTNLVICSVVLFYVFFGGVRGAAWANTFQTIVFIATGVIAFILIASKLGGLSAATEKVVEHAPTRLIREGTFGHAEFMSYALVPLSIGMFPHVFQHWLTARSAKSFRLTVVAHPIFIFLVWLPCILIGIWGASMFVTGDLHLPMLPGTETPNQNAVLGAMVGSLDHADWIIGILTAGVLAAIMSSLDSQFVCIGTMFANDVVIHHLGASRFNDKQTLWLGRGFVIVVVTVTYLLSLFAPRAIFGLGVWVFSGFAGLFPLVVAALYSKRVTRAAALACVLVTAGVWFALFAYNGFGKSEGLIAGMLPVVYVFLASVVTIIGVSLVTKPLPAEVVDRFFAKERGTHTND